MEPIGAIARLNLRDKPEFRAFKMPHPALRGWKFIVYARVMADAAAIYKETFVKRGLRQCSWKSSNVRSQPWRSR